MTPSYIRDLDKIFVHLAENRLSSTKSDQDIELIIDEYDPIYRRYWIRLIINNVTVALGHIRGPLCRLPFAPIITRVFNYNALQRLAKEVPLHPDLSTLINWVSTSQLADLMTNFVQANPSAFPFAKSKPNF